MEPRTTTQHWSQRLAAILFVLLISLGTMSYVYLEKRHRTTREKTVSKCIEQAPSSKICVSR